MEGLKEMKPNLNATEEVAKPLVYIAYENEIFCFSRNILSPQYCENIKLRYDANASEIVLE